MQRDYRPDGLDHSAAPLGRAQSLTGDRSSISGISSFQSSPPSAKPPPAYIAPSAASGIVTGEQQSLFPGLASDQDVDALNEVVLVSPESLALVNAFLDQLLYNFLAIARSTSLASLRPAVAEVLKPRLAKDAIAGADEELKEFLGGGDDEELSQFHGGQEPRGDWDLELVWKLTRLRCMVYTRLGDMEEDDEDEHLEREQLDDSSGGPRRFSAHIGTVSPAAAIFLTSIMEFVGEQTLLIAGDAARNRILSKQSPQDPGSPYIGADRMVVEVGDAEKIALDRTYGRLWRTWRRRVRSPSHSMSRPMSRDSLYRRGPSALLAGTTSRKSSIGATEDQYDGEDERVRPSVAEVLHEQDPADIPLPLGDNDVNEIEIPGIVRDGEDQDDGSKTPTLPTKLRPQSMGLFHSRANPPTPVSTETPDGDTILNDQFVSRSRSRSLPTPVQTPFRPPSDEELGESAFATPMESADPIAAMQVPESFDEDHLKTPTAATHSISREQEHSEEPSEEISRRSQSARIAAGAAIIGAAGVAAGKHLPSSTRSGSTDEKREDRVEDEEEGSGRTPMAANMNVPSISQHLVGELAPGNTGRNSRNSEIYVYMKEPHHGRDPSLTTTEAGDDDGYRNDGPHKNEGVMQGAADPEDLALSDDEEAGMHEAEAKAFVLSAAPSGRHPKPSSQYPIRAQQEELPHGVVSMDLAQSRTPGAENGVPPLTPLREMMEAAHDTGDEASRSSTSARWRRDSAPSQQERALSRQSGRSDVQSQSQFHTQHKQHSSGSSRTSTKYSDGRAQSLTALPPVQMQPQSQAHEAATAVSTSTRASVQRVTPPLTPREAGAVRNQRSESLGSLNDNKRPTTAGSATSRLSRKQTLPVRTSIDKAGIAGGGDFDNLVKSGQTIQYTLTPQNMREMESPDSPRWRNQPRTGTADLAQFFKTTAPPDDDRPKTSRSGASAKGLNGLRSHPPEQSARSQTTAPAITLKQRSADLVDASQKPKRKILGMQEARDARVEKSSTRDFADFIRSTGPDRPNQLPTTISSRPTTAHTEPSPRAAVVSHAPTTRASDHSSKIVRSQTVSPTTSTTPRRTNSKLEARPAALPQGNKSADLIEFIREGPPPDSRGTNFRTTRAVRPFRTAMDSDEMSNFGLQGAGATIDKDAIARVSVASTQESSVPTVSVHSSLNSRTGLLDSTSHPNGRSAKNAASSGAIPGNDMRPQRKQRRVRDPYAIDSDSDEEFIEPAPKPRRDEESLIDFLRNVAPPTEAQTTPQPLVNSASIPSSVQKKNSAGNIKDRIMRKSSVTNGARGRQHSEQLNLPARRSSAQGVSSTAPQIPPPRHVSPHLSQTGSRLDSYKPTQPTYAAHVDRDRLRSTRSVANAQARSGRSDQGGSSADLADFLKNSGPPAGVENPRPTAIKEESSFSKMFSRRKKAFYA